MVIRKAAYFKPTLAPGWVYGVQCGEYVKIGVAKDVSQRFAVFRLYNPQPCELIFKRKTVAPYHFERMMHDKLAAHGIGREWFRVNLDQIKEAAKEASAFAKHVAIREDRAAFDAQYGAVNQYS